MIDPRSDRVGSQELIERAYRWRKVLGGGMRQSEIFLSRYDDDAMINWRH